MSFYAAYYATENQADTITAMHLESLDRVEAYHANLAARQAEYEDERKDMLAAQALRPVGWKNSSALPDISAKRSVGWMRARHDELPPHVDEWLYQNRIGKYDDRRWDVV